MMEDNIFPLVLYLPFPISVNSYYARTRYGLRRSKRGNQFRKEAKDAISEQAFPECLRCKLSLTVILYPPDKRVRDLDNYMKSLQDVLNENQKEGWRGVYADDSLIDQLTIFRGQIVKSGKCVVIIDDAGPVLPNGYEDLIISGKIGVN